MAVGIGPASADTGDRIVFRAFLAQSVDDLAHPRLWVREADASVSKLPVTTYAFSWPPDGARIAYVDDGLHVIRSNGTGRRRLTVSTPEAYEYGAFWSPDGSRERVLARDARIRVSWSR